MLVRVWEKMLVGTIKTYVKKNTHEALPHV